MPLKCTCPRCGKLHRNIDKSLLGKKFQCDCGKVVRLGSPPKPKTTTSPQPVRPATRRPVKPVPVQPATAKQPKPVSSRPRPVAPARPQSSQPAARQPMQPAPVRPAPVQPALAKPVTPTPVAQNETQDSDQIRIVDSDDNLIDLTPCPTAPSAAIPASPEPQTPAASQASIPAASQPQSSAANIDEVDALIANVMETPAANRRGAATPVAPEPVPLAEAVDDDLVVIDEKGQDSGVSGYEQSFEVLDDESDEIIELSDIDVIGGLVQQPPAVSPAPAAPTHQMPDYINPAPVQPITHAATPQPAAAAAQPVPSGAPLTAPGEPTPTSTNPAYRQFGAPPPVLYPAEPPVPDAPAHQAAAGPGGAAMGHGPMAQGGAPHPALGPICMLAAVAGIVLGIWLVVSSLNYGQDAFAIGNFVASGKFLGFLLYARLFFAAIFVLAATMFLINEIIILAQGGSGIGGLAMFLLIATLLLIAMQFFVGCMNLYLNLFGNFSGAIIGDSFMWSLMQSVTICIVPIVVLFVAYLRA